VVDGRREGGAMVGWWVGYEREKKRWVRERRDRKKTN